MAGLGGDWSGMARTGMDDEQRALAHEVEQMERWRVEHQRREAEKEAARKASGHERRAVVHR